MVVYLVRKYTDAGARSKFEDICSSLFKKKFSKQYAKEVRTSGGDGGIDIFIGEIGKTPIHVIQCKFFFNGINKSQRNQIRASFKTAIDSTEYQCHKWTLCIPDKLKLSEHKWWVTWKSKQQQDLDLPDEFVQLIDGSDLIDQLKEFHLYNDGFTVDVQQCRCLAVAEPFALQCDQCA